MFVKCALDARLCVGCGQDSGWHHPPRTRGPTRPSSSVTQPPLPSRSVSVDHFTSLNFSCLNQLIQWGGVSPLLGELPDPKGIHFHS